MAFLDFIKPKQTDNPPLPQTISVSSLPFEAYKGKKPYIFISYAHADAAAVFPIIKEFHELGYNVWYDEGIEPGIAWPEEIGRALDGCGLFVVFITPRSVNSDNVDNEIYVALSKKKPFIAIHLEPTALTPGQELQFGKRQAILKYDMDAATFLRKYTYSFEATEVKTGNLRPLPIPEPAKPVSAPVPVPTPSPEPTPVPVPIPSPEIKTSAELDAFVPKGTAVITLLDGTQYTAIANTLIVFIVKSDYYARYPYRRLDDKASLPGSSGEALAFEDISSISFTHTDGTVAMLAACTDFDGETHIKEIPDKAGELWCITGSDQSTLTKMPLLNVSKIDLDYASAPDYRIPMTLIERKGLKSLLSPKAGVLAEHRISNIGRAPTFKIGEYIPLEISGETPFKRLRSLTVGNVTKEAAMFSPTVEADITILKKNGESVADRLNAPYTFRILNSNDIAQPAISTISKIVFDYTVI